MCPCVHVSMHAQLRLDCGWYTWIDPELLDLELGGQAGVSVGREGVGQGLEDGLVHGWARMMGSGGEGG